MIIKPEEKPPRKIKDCKVFINRRNNQIMVVLPRRDPAVIAMINELAGVPPLLDIILRY